MNKRFEMLDLMRTIANGLIGVEVMADYMAEVSAELDAAGDKDAANVLRMLARNHRVRFLELQGQLAAASVDYASLRQGVDGEA
ncbi:hypothetical protein FF100_36025 [Methylobacterium terricola]|uniref:Uncharacterized protein n=1 Tax=Methylobacterium terricola TaxID=2583531 RepID=A0A5C4L691_9HYPH|nr:hypothetical protein [Methylobacterium terricola]TNC05220.1 hypothetical protein FF100_36025 [Methylobacterium terricola]